MHSYCFSGNEVNSVLVSENGCVKHSIFRLFHFFFCALPAIVRAVDPSSGLIYLTTGIPPSDLEKVNTICRGQVDLPTSLFVEQVCPFVVF